jgi:tetratricopeptide (TPR) repeat protein
MRQLSLHCRPVLWVTPIVGPLFIMALIGPGLGVAQMVFCSEDPRSAANANKDVCSDPRDPFNLPAVSDQSRRPEAKALTVTIHQLRHVTPKKALKEKENAEKAFGQHRTEEAIGHLENAVRIDPEFVWARNDLAALHLRMNDPYPAIEQLNEAIKFDPHFPLLFINLAIGYIETGDLSDAERAAREAADLDRVKTLPRYLLATTLYYQKKFTEEALQCAKETSDDYPAAHLFAARILIERNNFEPARIEIRAYLSGNRQSPEFATTANSWLDFMARHEQKPSAVAP